jgi:hypothetical protein
LAKGANYGGIEGGYKNPWRVKSQVGKGSYRRINPYNAVSSILRIAAKGRTMVEVTQWGWEKVRGYRYQTLVYALSQGNR